VSFRPSLNVHLSESVGVLCRSRVDILHQLVSGSRLRLLTDVFRFFIFQFSSSISASNSFLSLPFDLLGVRSWSIPPVVAVVFDGPDSKI
jgi:hypothetical protein